MNQGYEHGRSFRLRLQLTVPGASGLQYRRNLARNYPNLVNRSGDRRLIGEQLMRRSRHGPLDFRGGQAPRATHPVCRAEIQSTGDVVAVAPHALARVARGQARAGGVEQFAGERAGLDLHRAQPSPRRIFMQLLLHPVPEFSFHDGSMLARMAHSAMADFTYIERIAQHHVERAARERVPLVGWCAVARAPRFGNDFLAVELVLEQPYAAELQVAAEDQSYHLGLS